MCKKGLWKNWISFLVGILVIACIMSFPIMYFRRIDANRYNTRHYMEKITFALNTDVENVSMVGELHRILKSPYQTLRDWDIGLVEAKSGFEITLKSVGDELEEDMQIKDGGILMLYYDKVTNKVVRATYKPKNYDQEKYTRNLCTRKGDEKLESEMKSFLKYLGLNVIEDWKYYSIWENYQGFPDVYGKKKLDVYEKAKKEEMEFEWEMVSENAKLALYAVPGENGVKYYFEAIK